MLVCVEVFPLQMEGVRLMVNKGLTNYFQVRDSGTVSTEGFLESFPSPKHLFMPLVLLQVNHTVLLSTVGDSSYRFGTTYVGSKQTAPSEVGCGQVPSSSPSGTVGVWVMVLCFVFSSFPSWWQTWTTAAASTHRSSTRSPTGYAPRWLSR